MGLTRPLLSWALALLLVAPASAQQIQPANTSGSLMSTSAVTLTTSSYGSVAIQLSGTFSATVQFEGSVDASNYLGLQCSALATGSTATSATATGVWICSTGGLKSVRARVSAYTSGTVGVNLQAAAAGGGGGGGGGGAASSVTINDPNTTSQKAAVNASGQLSITCANCSGSGASAVDESAFTQGTNSIAPSGGLFSNAYTALTSGQAGIAQITSDGAFFTNVSKILGTAIDVNSGNTSAGTQRMVLATDQPALTNALKVDPSAVTSPISAAALPLPSGAATAAKQPALGTAGTASSNVITVQGIASMTALKVDGSGVTQPVSGTVTANLGTLNGAALDASVTGLEVAQASTTSGQKGAVVQGAVTTNAPSYTTAQTDPLSLDTSGLLRVSLKDTPVNTTALKVDGSAVTQPVSAASLPLPSGAATSANQTNASQKTQIVDGSGNVIASTSNNLNVQCANCSGSGASAVDEATFTAAASVFAPSGGFFQTTATNNALTNGQQGMAQLTAQRAVFTNLRNASGAEVGTSSTPLQVSLANTAANSTAVKVDGSAVTQPVSGTVTTSPPSNASTNVAQLAGTTTDTNSGVKSAGTLRVVIATDQPQLTNKLLVTPDSIALPANQSVNISQVNAHTLVEAGVNGTQVVGGNQATNNNVSTNVDPVLVAGSDYGGTPKIQNVKVDASGFVHATLEASTGASHVVVDSGSLTANQSVNVAQMNGVTTSMNSGAADTGTQRVVIANDFDPCRNQSNTKSFVSITQTANTQLLGVSGSSKRYYICSLNVVTATAQNLALVDSTTAGNACATSPSGSDGFGGSTAATGWNLAANGGLTYGAGGFAIGQTHNTNAALCLLQSGAGQVSGGLSYVTQ